MYFRINAEIFARYDKLVKLGVVVFQHNRIVSARLKIPVYKKKVAEQKNKACDTFYKKSEEKFEIHELKNAFHFTLERNCKAEWPYRKYKLTHRIVSEELQTICPSAMFIKLSAFQETVINYCNKNYIWQTKPFQQKLWEETAKWFLLLLLGSLGTFLVLSAKSTREKRPINEGFTMGREKNEEIQPATIKLNTDSFTKRNK